MSDTSATEPEAEPEVFEVLAAPGDGVPDVVDDAAGLAAVVDSLSQGSGPVAVDAERASGYRYGQDAYLVQLRREGSGTHLIDPLGCPDLSSVDRALADTEWVLHAATQDIPCLAALGMRPRRLFDTELGARLAGLPKVGLSSVLEYYLGLTLAKEHSAVDWSTRPLPTPWLLYAALDVELLVPLRDRMVRDLSEQGKLAWAKQEFDALTSFTGPKTKPDPWRRVSGTRALRTRRHLATLREVWNTREEIARHRDVAPGRIVPDSTLVDLALRAPRRRADLPAVKPDPHGARQRRAQQGLRRHAAEWLAAISAAAEIPEDELPQRGVSTPGPPPARSWADRDPDAAARLNATKPLMKALSDQHDIPVENLVTPEALRRVLWQPPQTLELASVEAALAEVGARPWQQQIVAPVVLQALGSLSGATRLEWEISHM
ncbi:MAG TPA: HRDC domain-containing protein [Ornithinimicrobium sp.]|uniref:ribonuclease D n=1 Tax=Ornithinimicrobium sp. TaxID=1977084 RepID=UPI002B47A222|nr:HRDC domain-containing protein [Ornithinimicrobium sp.]HKJ10976.1 HRDC domain-containing protein [Ornithinimicrobium sp.]